jgi:hypothetical protein
LISVHGIVDLRSRARLRPHTVKFTPVHASCLSRFAIAEEVLLRYTIFSEEIWYSVVRDAR